MLLFVCPFVADGVEWNSSHEAERIGQQTGVTPVCRSCVQLFCMVRT